MSEELKSTTNWPDPNRPGVPMFPERNGWHVVTFWRNDRQVTGFWHAEKQKWGSIDGVYTFTPQDAVNNIKYDAASLTPTQINEILAAERERCISACENEGKAFESPEYAGGKSNAWGELFAVSECIEAIRNLGAAP